MRTTMREVSAVGDWSEQWSAPWKRSEYLAPVVAFGLALLIAYL
jgi:hypothetical protein